MTAILHLTLTILLAATLAASRVTLSTPTLKIKKDIAKAQVAAA